MKLNYLCCLSVRDLPIPQVQVVGEIDGWPYAIITWLPGVPVARVWNNIGLDQKSTILHELGSFVRQLHAHEMPHGLRSDWDSFLSDRLKASATHHGVDIQGPRDCLLFLEIP